mgnify:CR=1 FL=1
MNQSIYGRENPQNQYVSTDPIINPIHQGMSTQKVTLGPIIGKTTDTSARVMLEFLQDGEEVLTLTAPDGQTHTCRRHVIANRPVVFQFDNLLPQTKYTVTSNYPFQCTSAFRTLSLGPAPINFAFLSCNSRKAAKKYHDKNNLWSDLGSRACSDQVDYIIHLGDQVYADYCNDIYERCIKILESTPKKDWPKAGLTIQEMMREEYRQTYGGRLEAIALANCPNLMQFDDHEFRDDMGFRPEDSDPETADGYYIQLMRVIYYEYQRQLRDDIDFSNLDAIKYEFHSHIINNIGLFFLDYRGKGSWLRAPEKGQLGKLQWEALERALDPYNGDFKNCNMFILVSPIPVVLYSHGWTKVIKQVIDDAQEEWEFEHQEEHARLLNLMEQWKRTGNGTREVFIVGGDVHHAGFTDIKKGNQTVFCQMVTSGMCQKGLGPAAMFMSRLMMRVGRKIYDDWTFKHHDWTARNNYGLVSLTDPGTNSFSAQIVTSRRHSSIRLEKPMFYNFHLAKYGQKADKKYAKFVQGENKNKVGCKFY